jgi:hypothetical protein
MNDGLEGIWKEALVARNLPGGNKNKKFWEELIAYFP